MELKKKNVAKICNILFAQSLMARSAYVKFDTLGTKRNISSATRQPGKTAYKDDNIHDIQ